MTRHGISRVLPVTAAVAFSCVLVWVAFAAEPAPQPGAAGQSATPVAGAIPYPLQASAAAAATQSIAPFDVAKLKVVGLLGDPRFRHVSSVMQIAITSDGKQLASLGRKDDAVHVWDVATGREVHRLASKDGEEIRAFVFWPDGKRLAAAIRGGAVAVWNLETAQIVRTLEQENVASLAVAPDGQTLFAGDDGGKIIQWNFETGQAVRQLRDNSWRSDRPMGVLIPSLDGNSLLSNFGWSSGAILWNLQTGQRVWSIPPTSLVAMVAAFRPQRDEIAIALSVEMAHRVRLVAAADRKKEIWNVSMPAAVTAMAFSPDGKVLAISCEDSKIHLLSSLDGKEIRTLALEGESSQSMAFNGKGDILFGCDRKTICQWDVATGKRVFPAPAAAEEPAPNAVWRMAISPDGRFLYTVGEYARRVEVWNLARGVVEKRWSMVGIKKMSSSITSLTMSPSGERLLVGTYDHHAAILDTATGKVASMVSTFPIVKTWWTWGPNDAMVVATEAFANPGTERGIEAAPKVTVLDLVHGTEKSIGEGHVACVLDFSFSAGWAVASQTVGDDEQGFRSSDLEFWRLSDWVQIESVPLGSASDKMGPNMATILEDGRSMVTFSNDGSLRQWGRRPTPTTMPAAKDMARWVQDLGSGDYRLREEATKKLGEAGPGAEAALAKADANDADVAVRLATIHLAWEELLLPDQLVGAPLDLKHEAFAMEVHPDQRHWAVGLTGVAPEGSDGGRGGEIVIGELTTTGPRIMRRLKADYGPMDMKFSPDGKTLYVGNGNATISIYRAE